MTTTQLKPFDCKVEVRKCVLIANPSRWKQKGPRVIVYSPIHVPTATSLVPVKRFSRGEEDTVCFMPRGDIEKRTSKIYEKLEVSIASMFIHAHGMAIVDGLNDGFQFSKMDMFWIHIGSDIEHYKTTSTVPVINLRTFEEGVVDAEHVCWFPKLKGSDEDLWTPGGTIREQKLFGSNNFVYWSFAVRQKLDGTLPKVDFVQMPDRDSNMQDSHKLTAAERRALFEEICKCQMRRLSTDVPLVQTRQSRRSPFETRTSVSPKTYTAFLIPRASVDSSGHESISTIDIEKRGRRPAMTSIRADVMRRWPKPNPQWAYRVRPPGLFHTNRSTSVHCRGHTRRLSIDSEGPFDDESISDDDFSSRTPSPQPQSADQENIRSGRQDSDWNEDDELCAKVLFDLARDACDSTSAPMNDHLGNDLDSISGLYAWEKGDPTGRIAAVHKARNARLCELEDPDCEYSMMHPAKHYHSPAEKCRTGLDHEHCISRLSPDPGRAGDCLLLLKKYRYHRCCWWGIPRSLPKLVEHDDRKQKEAQKKGLPLYDLSGRGLRKDWGTSHEGVEMAMSPIEEVDDLRSAYDLESVDEMNVQLDGS